MTMVQFNLLTFHLSRKINWDVQVAALSAGNPLEAKYHPLSVDPDLERKRNRGEQVRNNNNGQSLEEFEARLREYVI